MAFVAEVRSLAHVLGQTVGRAYQASCDAALGDARCGVTLEAPAFKGSGVVLALVRDRGFVASGLGAFATGWFASGTVEWASGANAGRRAEVMMHEVAVTEVSITLMEIPIRALATGDAFVIRAGCDKRLETFPGSVRQCAERSRISKDTWAGCSPALCRLGRCQSRG